MTATIHSLSTFKLEPINDEFRFEFWLKDANLEVATVYELATGLSFPRKGKIWVGLHQELKAIKSMMLRTDGQTLGFYADLWLHSRVNR